MARRAEPSPSDLPHDDPVPEQAIDEQLVEDETAEEGAERQTFLIRNEVRKRLDLYLRGRLRNISRSRVQKLIDAGGVTINAKVVKASTLVRQGDRVEIILPPPAIRTIDPEDIPLNILYEDDWLVVINKQANLIVHPARSNLRGTLVNALAHHFKKQIEARGGQWATWRTRGFRSADQPATDEPSPKAGRPEGAVEGLSGVGADDLRPGIIHRLDRNTTGVMVVAKNDDAHWAVARQFEDRKTLKAYLALVHGGPEDAGGVIDQPIGKHPTLREPYAVRHDSSGKPSITLYRVRERYKGYTLLELELKTGRTHQIRVHLSYLGWPIAGDTWYGGEPIGRKELDEPPIPAGGRKYLNFARDREEGERVEAAAKSRGDLLLATPALHAALLGFHHPILNKPMIFTAPVHEPMRTLLTELRKRPAPGPVATGGTHVDLSHAIPSA